MKELFVLKRQLNGVGKVLFDWDPTGSYLATIGQSKRLTIYNRNGQVYDELSATISTNNGNNNNMTNNNNNNNSNNKSISQNSSVISLCWDSEGQYLSVLYDNSSTLLIYNLHNKKRKEVDLNMKDSCFMVWSKHSPILAIGSGKGNLLLFNAQTNKQLLIAGKHSKKISCGRWNKDNQLILASVDKMMTISDEKGELLEQTKLKYEPFDIQISNQKIDSSTNNNNSTVNSTTNNSDSETTISINMGHATILLYNTNDSDNPVELAFQSKYGDIIGYYWFGDGYMMIAFSRGYLIAISTHMKEIGEELQSLKICDSLSTFTYNSIVNKIAIAGDEGIKIINANDWKEIKEDNINYSYEEGDIDKLDWSNDGQILTVSTTGGYIFTYLTSLPLLSASNQQKLIYLSNLREVSIHNIIDNSTVLVNVDIEPTIVACSNNIIGVGMNNHCYYYNANNTIQNQENNSKNSVSNSASPLVMTSDLILEKEYISSVDRLEMNDNFIVALLKNNKLILHTLNGYYNNDIYEDKVFDATSLSLTNEFLIYSYQNIIYHYNLVESKIINEFKHEGGNIIALYSNNLGTRVIFVDNNHKCYFYNPIDDLLLDVPSFVSTASIILFDLADNNCFITIDNKTTKNIITYVYTPITTKGSTITKLNVTKLGNNSSSSNNGSNNNVANSDNTIVIPLVFSEGVLYGQRSNSSIYNINLSSHDSLFILTNKNKRTPEKLRLGLNQLISLNRLKSAFDISLIIKLKEQLIIIARKALDQLELELAIRIYKELKELSMVLAIQKLLVIEEKSLLSAHICLLMGDYNRAQILFLQSSKPLLALEMRKDLLQWDIAIKLATTLAPKQLPLLLREYAANSEIKAEYEQAANHYEKSIQQTEVILDNNTLNNNNNLDNNSGINQNTALTLSEEKELLENKRLSHYGLVRMTLRLGQLQKGLSMINLIVNSTTGDNTNNFNQNNSNTNNNPIDHTPSLPVNSLVLLRDCGLILEQLHQYGDAAELYVRGECYDKATNLYLKLNLLNKITPLLKYLTSNKLLIGYAAGKELNKEYNIALKSYERAGDINNCIRLYLYHLDEPELAFNLARQHKSVTGANLIANYCINHINISSAIEFLLLAQKSNEAFLLAKLHNSMSIFAEQIGDNGTYTEYKNIVNYYENEEKNHEMTAHYYDLLNDYSKAIKYYLLILTPTSKHINAAINVVKKANDSKYIHSENLIRQLHDYLIGETDGVVKDLNYIFQLYLNIGEYSQAASTALLIAQQEQTSGQYNAAHAILLNISLSLNSKNINLSNELKKQLLLLHSYKLAKINSTKSDHLNAARMLLRVSKNISKFPCHIVPILTSTVIECQRAKLQHSAYQYASILMRGEYRNSIDKKYRKPIELFVRRGINNNSNNTNSNDNNNLNLDTAGNSNGGVDVEDVSPCPYCHANIPVSLLECYECKNSLPWCITTGLHLVVNDWTQCPNCNFNSLYSKFIDRINNDKTCCMCNQEITLNQIIKIEDVSTILRNYSSTDATNQNDYHNIRNEEKNKNDNSIDQISGSKNNTISNTSNINIHKLSPREEAKFAVDIEVKF